MKQEIFDTAQEIQMKLESLENRIDALKDLLQEIDSAKRDIIPQYRGVRINKNLYRTCVATDLEIAEKERKSLELKFDLL